jgi:hypothetical protein
MTNLSIFSPGKAAALLKVDGLTLMLSQSDIRAIEATVDVDRTDPATFSVGWIVYAQQRWPVYCFSADLRLNFEIPSVRRTCVLMTADDGYVGILADDVSILRQIPERHYPLPDILKLPGSPVQYLMLLEGAIVCATDAHNLYAHIGRLC